MGIKACIFDLDGTLCYTLESMAVVVNGVLKELGLRELPTENFRYYCGEGAHVMIGRCLQDAGDNSLQYMEQAEEIYRERFNRDPLYKVKIYPGMEETLKRLKKEGVLLSVCSNKPHPATCRVIGALFGSEVFSGVQGQQEGLRRKPAPDIPLRLAENLGVKPSECMYVGDSGTDMETGRAAGMRTVGALWGYRGREELEEAGAMVLAGAPEELYAIYKEMTEE